MGYDDASIYYATDGSRVYEDAGRHYPKLNAILEGADPKTFKPIRHNFAKDRSHVWYLGKLIGGADPNTFVITGDISTGTIARDDKHTYSADSKDNIVVER